MGFCHFFFGGHQQWYEFYEKNCSFKNQSEWLAEGKPNIPVGLVYFISGIFYELIYLPFLIAIVKHDFFQYSCNKLIFLMSIINFLVLPSNAILTGIQVMKGVHYCNNPKLYFVIGAIGTCGFYGAATLCVILAFNRFLAICFPKIAIHVFGEKRIYFWMFISILYPIYIAFFQPPQIFSIKIYASNYDPFYLIDGMKKISEFVGFQYFFLWNNCLIIAFLVFFYTNLIVIFKIKTFLYPISTTISNEQKLMTIQALCICGLMVLASLFQIIIFFWEFPVIIKIIAHFGWISLYGSIPIICFVINPSIRKTMIEIIRKIFGFSQSSCKNANNLVYSANQSSHVAPADTNLINQITTTVAPWTTATPITRFSST